LAPARYREYAGNKVKRGDGSGMTASRSRVVARGLDDYPAHAESRRRLLTALDDGSLDGTVRAVQADVALTLRLLRSANRGSGARTRASVTQAAQELRGPRLRALAESIPVDHPLDRMTLAGSVRERFRMHALAVRRVTDRLAVVSGRSDGEELATAAVLHDVGKLVLGDDDASASDALLSPEQRAASERARLGADHARVGGQLAGQWAFPERLGEAIECHHEADGDSPGAMVRLADMLVHYGAGHLIDLECVVGLSQALGIKRSDLGDLMYELPEPILSSAPPVREPCSLSARELQILGLLASGSVYKQIAHQLDLSPSTVRSHLHRIYTRIGAADRTQAVLIARQHGWI